MSSFSYSLSLKKYVYDIDIEKVEELIIAAFYNIISGLQHFVMHCIWKLLFVLVLHGRAWSSLTFRPHLNAEYSQVYNIWGWG